MFSHLLSINVIMPMLEHIVYKSTTELITPKKLLNSMSEVQFSTFQIHHALICFTVKPKVEAPKSTNDQTCTIGQNTQISWKFSGIEKPDITWLFNGQPLPTNERFQLTEMEDGTSTLSIRNAQLSDKGVYTAKGTNAVGEVEAKTTLNIVGIKPVIINDVDGTLQAIKDESLTIKVTATGTPKPDIVWMHGNDELVPNDRIEVTTPTSEGDDTYILTVSNIRPEDQGEYSAKIINVGGTVKTKKCKVSISSKYLCCSNVHRSEITYVL